LYRNFSGNDVRGTRYVTDPGHSTFVQVGSVDGILYTTNREGKTEKYIHHFRRGSRPAMLVSPDGKMMRTHGGHFVFTDRGFVDHDTEGNPLE
jgi:hypothetical protein